MPPTSYPFERPLGAFPAHDGSATFRVWAPRPQRVTLRVGNREHALEDAGYGILEATVEARPGEDYAFVISDIEFPDPASRWQASGLRGRSRLLDTGAFEWTDEGFEPPEMRDLVIYELHVGTFTPEGTFEAVISHLRGLRELGVTTIELMPVAAFPGRHGWGYDGVYISAAHDPYGGPPGLARLVDAAHAEGIAVLLDVVYNHVGASGVQGLEAFGPYFTTHYETPWGRAMNYDDADSDALREWVLQSAEQWIRDFRLDGLRLDAIHAIVDANPKHPVAAARCRRGRSSSSPPTTIRSGTARSATACRRRPGRSPRSARFWHRSRRCCSRARSTASGRRSSSSRTTSTRRSPRRHARAAGASSSTSTSRRSRTRRNRRRSNAPRSRATASRPGSATSTSRCCARGRSCRTATLTPSTSTSTPAGCASAAGRTLCSPTSPCATCTCPSKGASRPWWPRTTPPSNRGSWSSRPSREHCSSDRSLARTAFSARRRVGRAGNELLALLRERGAGRGVPVR